MCSVVHIIDDDILMMQSLKQSIEFFVEGECNVEVLTHNSPTNFFKYVSQGGKIGENDFFVVDYNMMPDIDGVTLIKKIKQELAPNNPIVLFTGNKDQLSDGENKELESMEVDVFFKSASDRRELIKKIILHTCKE